MATSRNGPVIVIEDDIEDKEILTMVFDTLKYPNDIVFFPDGQQALDYLSDNSVTPFIILSDINLPKLDGFALRDKIRMDANLQTKCIPYLFFTTASNSTTVVNAYSLSVQGFFIKPSSIDEVTATVKCIMEYWLRCVSPNSF
jgi:DNA-binding response OmpR family regulator